MSPERVFQVLTVLGLAAGGWLYGDYCKKAGLPSPDNDRAATLRAENSELIQRVDTLEDELAQVRSMLSNGPFPVPDDIISWVEKDYDMVFLKAPNVRLASPTAVRDAAHANLRLIHGEIDLEHEGLAWELLGLLPPNQRLFTQLLFVNSSGVKGVCDLSEQRILLSENFDAMSVPDRSVLVRLLGQLLAYQNHPRKEWGSRDEWQAWEAVHTGSAAAQQARFLRRNPAANQAGWSDPEPAREQLLNDLEPALQGFCNFPFIEGADFSRYFFIDSREAWAAMFRNPPSTTAAVLHPNQKNREAVEITFPNSGPEIIHENTIGELGLRLWLEPFAGMDESGLLAQQWRGDRYQLRRNPDGQFSLSWKIALADAKSAKSLKAEVERSMIRHFHEAQALRQTEVTVSDTVLNFTNSPKK
ncbi:MAG: hypothetical protein P8M04_07295 [Akkermansiaceae bacterium]|jgi:hypothetical protein|nr:hypothetical protein [Akkermansiaceae bacterium]